MTNCFVTIVCCILALLLKIKYETVSMTHLALVMYELNLQQQGYLLRRSHNSLLKRETRNLVWTQQPVAGSRSTIAY